MANPGARTMPWILAVRREGQWEAELGGSVVRTPSRARLEFEAAKVGTSVRFPNEPAPVAVGLAGLRCRCGSYRDGDGCSNADCGNWRGPVQ